MLKRKKHKKKTSLQRTKPMTKILTETLPVPKRKPIKYKFPLDRVDIMEDKDGNKVKKYTLKQLNEMLNDRQKQTAHYYIRDWNLKQAMIASGYSEAYADSRGFELLGNVGFRQYVRYIQRDVAKEVGFSKIGLLTILWNQAKSNLGMVFDDWMTRKDFNEIKEQHPDFMYALKEVTTRIERRQDRDGNIIETEWVKLSMYDSQKAIELIMKAMGWSGAVAVKLDADIKKTVTIQQYTQEEKKVLLEIARKNDYYRESD